MKCSKRMCPMQHNAISDDCDIKNCMYRTEDVDPQEVVKALCNYIADLVVQKLEAKIDVIDKIRDEIEQIEINGHVRDIECFRAGINTALNVIDKYREE